MFRWLGKCDRRKLRWFQFRLRSLLGLMVLCSVAFAALSAYALPYWAEQRVIAQLPANQGLAAVLFT